MHPNGLSFGSTIGARSLFPVNHDEDRTKQTRVRSTWSVQKGKAAIQSELNSRLL